MIKFIILDDEPKFREKMIAVVNKTMKQSSEEYSFIQFDCYNKEFETLIKEDSYPKIYLMDIELPGKKSGIDISRKIREYDWNSIIILVTSHTELGYEALKAQIMVLDFISKFNDCEINLAKTLKRAIPKLEQKKVITYISNGSTYRIFVDDILYITKDTVDRKCVIKTAYTEFVINKTIAEMCDEMDNRFYMSHRSCLVNVRKIRTINWRENSITFINGEKIYMLSRERKKGLKEYVSIS